MAGGVELPTVPGGYRCILMDPAWGFRTYSGNDAVPTLAADPYRTMTIEEIKALRVQDVAAQDCLLVMWVVSSHITQAIECAEAWGFTYRSIGLVWLKDRFPGQSEMFDDPPICSLGMGYWFRQQAEISLVFGRGSPSRKSASVRQAIVEPRREHSRKPECQYERIEALIDGPYLEMFARARRPGWDAWGNETEKFGAAA